MKFLPKVPAGKQSLHCWSNDCFSKLLASPIDACIYCSLPMDTTQHSAGARQGRVGREHESAAARGQLPPWRGSPLHPERRQAGGPADTLRSLSCSFFKQPLWPREVLRAAGADPSRPPWQAGKTQSPHCTTVQSARRQGLVSRSICHGQDFLRPASLS